MYNKVVKLVLYITFIFLFTVVITGCSKPVRSQNNEITGQKGQEQIIEEADINEAKSVIEKHFKAIREGNYDVYKSTLGKYQDYYVQQERTKKLLSAPRQVELIEVSQPGKYLKDVPPQSYISYFNKTPYKTIIFHVTYNGSIDTSDEDNGNTSDIDYVLVKDTPDSEWKIHSWGV